MPQDTKKSQGSSNRPDYDDRQSSERRSSERQSSSRQSGQGRKQGGSDAPRGFAAMDPERQREIASEGGRAAHEQGTAHEFDSEEARAAGRKSHQGNSHSAQSRQGGKQGSSSGSPGGPSGTGGSSGSSGSRDEGGDSNRGR